ncbi:MAG: hypothetical protein JNK05_21585 [Myxococcales bacterium]|nr:hypothetical protein [Myxococcales bacterium]
MQTALWLSFLFIAGWSATFRLRAFEASASIDRDDDPNRSQIVGVGPFRFAKLAAPAPNVSQRTRNALWAALSAAAFIGAASLWKLLATAHDVTRELDRPALFRARGASTMDLVADHAPGALVALVSLALAIALHRAAVRTARKTYAAA